MLQSDRQLWPFSVLDRHGHPVVEVNVSGAATVFSPEEVLGWNLRHVLNIYLQLNVSTDFFHGAVVFEAYSGGVPWCQRHRCCHYRARVLQ